MHAFLLIAASLLTQNASMTFNNSTHDTMRVWVWCYGHRDWANNGDVLYIQPSVPRTLPLHTGSFQLTIRSKDNVSIIRNRTLSLNENDNVKIIGLYGGGKGTSPISAWRTITSTTIRRYPYRYSTSKLGEESWE